MNSPTRSWWAARRWPVQEIPGCWLVQTWRRQEESWGNCSDLQEVKLFNENSSSQILKHICPLVCRLEKTPSCFLWLLPPSPAASCGSSLPHLLLPVAPPSPAASFCSSLPPSPAASCGPSLPHLLLPVAPPSLTCCFLLPLPPSPAASCGSSLPHLLLPVAPPSLTCCFLLLLPPSPAASSGSTYRIYTGSQLPWVPPPEQRPAGRTHGGGLTSQSVSMTDVSLPCLLIEETVVFLYHCIRSLLFVICCRLIKFKGTVWHHIVYFLPLLETIKD